MSPSLPMSNETPHPTVANVSPQRGTLWVVVVIMQMVLLGGWMFLQRGHGGDKQMAAIEAKLNGMAGVLETLVVQRTKGGSPQVGSGTRGKEVLAAGEPKAQLPGGTGVREPESQAKAEQGDKGVGVEARLDEIAGSLEKLVMQMEQQKKVEQVVAGIAVSAKESSKALAAQKEYLTHMKSDLYEIDDQIKGLRSILSLIRSNTSKDRQ